MRRFNVKAMSGKEIVICDMHIGSKNSTALNSFKFQVEYYKNIGIDIDEEVIDVIKRLHNLALKLDTPLSDIVIHSLVAADEVSKTEAKNRGKWR